MKKICATILTLTNLLFGTFWLQGGEAPIIAGYYRSGKDWMEKYPYTEYGQLPYTHIIHIGNFPYDPETKKLTVRDPGRFPSPEMAKYMHKHNKLVMLSVASGNDFFGNKVCKTPEDIKAYAKQLVDVVINAGYDGIDVDWEHPNRQDLGKKWDQLIAELRSNLDIRGKKDQRHYLLSAALPPGYWVLWCLDKDAAVKNLDFINVMAYDLGLWNAGDHAKLTDIKSSMEYWKKVGIPGNKIVMGVPFYAFMYSNSEINTKFDSKTGKRNQQGYGGIKARIERENWQRLPGTNIYHSEDRKNFSALEDVKEIMEKSEEFKKMGYRGVFSWCISLDHKPDGYPLVKAMAAPWTNGKTAGKVINGFVVNRNFDIDSAEYLVDDKIFSFLTDATLLGGVPKLEDITVDSSNKYIQEFMNRTKSYNLRRWASTAPSSNAAMDTLMADPEKMRVNARNIAEFLASHGFDGLDIDWEYPKENQWEPFSRYILILNEALAAKGKKLSLALAPWGRTINKDAIAVVDHVNIMAYDLMRKENGNRHSTFESAQHSIDHFVKHGFPREKLLLGLPFYGRHVYEKSLPQSQWRFYHGHEGSYKNFISLFPDLPASSDELEGYYFNGIDMIKRKSQLVKEAGIGGVMIWEMGFDLPPQDPRSLLRSIVATMSPEKLQRVPDAGRLPLPWPGGLSCNLWLDLPGDKLSDLLESPSYPQNPKYKSYVYNLKSPDWRANYGARIYGLITPPLSGKYTFFLTSKGDSVLYLSDTDAKDGMKKIAEVTSKNEKYPEGGQWDLLPGQKSPAINLTAGKKYYIEIMHKVGSEKGHLTVNWQLPDGKNELIRFNHLSR